jgi:hypothetical protein
MGGAIRADWRKLADLSSLWKRVVPRVVQRRRSIAISSQATMPTAGTIKYPA